MSPAQAQRKITKAFHYAELAYCEIEDVLRERPGTLPDDLVQNQRDADILWHRQTKRLLQHIEQARKQP